MNENKLIQNEANKPSVFTCDSMTCGFALEESNNAY
jgi:hypothetical protein